MGSDKPYILLESRPENVQGLIDLKLRDVFDCIPYLTALMPDHFSHALVADPYQDLQAAAEGRHLWVFGVLVGKKNKTQRPAYVKIQLGTTPANPVCISFHPAGFPIEFLFSSDHSTQFKRVYDAQS